MYSRLITLLLSYSISMAVDPPSIDVIATTDGDSVYVQLTWNPVGNAQLYKVYSKSNLSAEYELLASTNNTSISHSIPTNWDWQAQPDITGFYRVTAVETLLPNGMIYIPSGSFAMGQVGVVTPEHMVTLTHDFMVSQTEVTNGEFANAAQWAVENGHASVISGDLYAYGQLLLDMTSTYCEIAFTNGTFLTIQAQGADDWGYNTANYFPENHPVKLMTWYGAACYCDWMSMMDGLPPYYQGQWSEVPGIRNPYIAQGYRMPTEAEWEYAGQYNDERMYAWGNENPSCSRSNYNMCIAWTCDVGTHPAGQSQLGLMDMAGNNAEFTNDWYSTYTSAPLMDPAGPASGSMKVVKGGGWGYSLVGQKLAERLDRTPSYTSYGLGFRICRSIH